MTLSQVLQETDCPSYMTPALEALVRQGHATLSAQDSPEAALRRLREFTHILVAFPIPSEHIRQLRVYMAKDSLVPEF